MEHTKLPWIAYVENLGHGHYGKIKLVTQKHLDENLLAIGEIKSPHDANFIVRAVNAHDDLLAACECVEEKIDSGEYLRTDDREYEDLKAAIAATRGE